MADITMCQGIVCDMRNDCYRYRAIPSEAGQSWADFYWHTGNCDYFMSIGGRPVLGPDWQESDDGHG